MLWEAWAHGDKPSQHFALSGGEALWEASPDGTGQLWSTHCKLQHLPKVQTE